MKRWADNAWVVYGACGALLLASIATGNGWLVLGAPAVLLVAEVASGYRKTREFGMDAGQSEQQLAKRQREFLTFMAVLIPLSLLGVMLLYDHFRLARYLLDQVGL